MAARAILPRFTRRDFYYWAAPVFIVVFLLVRPIPVAVAPDLAARPGEQLLHPELGPELSSWTMPGASVFAATVHSVPAGRAAALLGLPVLLCALLAFSLGCELESPLAGAVAAALAFTVMAKSAPLNLDQLLLADCVLLTGALLTAPLERPRLRDLAAGGAVAASLLVRGVLAPFPVIVALTGFVFRRDPRLALRRAAALSALPLLVILVWGFAQRAANGRFVFLEWSGDRADSNLIAGALGLTGTIEGDAYGLSGVSPRGGVLAWAAGEIARHPVRFAFAVARRVALAAGLAPPLFLAGLIGAWRCSRREEFAPVVALAGWFLLFHCLMSVESRYFLPLGLLACPLAASCLGLIPALRGAPPRAAPVAWLGFVPIAAASACVVGLLLRHPAVERSGRAGADFDAARRLEGLGEARFGALLSAFARAASDPALEGFASDDEEDDLHVAVLKAFVRLEQGRDSDARAAFARARALWFSEKSLVKRPDGPQDAEVQARLRDNDTGMINLDFNRIFFALPKARRLALARRLPRLGVSPLDSYDRLIARFPRNETYRHDRGVVNLLLGRRPQAEADIKAAIALDPDFKEAYRSLAAACMESGDRAGAIAAGRALLARPGLPGALREEVRRELAGLEAARR